MLRSGSGRSQLLRLGLVLLLVVLAVILLIHLVGMDHSSGMALAGMCLFLLVAAVILAVPEAMRRPLPTLRPLPYAAWLAPTAPACRPPPREGPLRGVVLLD